MNPARFDLHLDRLLPASERAQAEREFGSDPSLASELALQRRIDDRLRVLFAAGAGVPTARAARSFTWLRGMALAAAALLLVSLCLTPYRAGMRATDGRAWGAWLAETERSPVPIEACSSSWSARPTTADAYPEFPLALAAGTLARHAGQRGLAGADAWWIEWEGARALVIVGPLATTPRIATTPEDGLLCHERVIGALRVQELRRAGPNSAPGALERLSSR